MILMFLTFLTALLLEGIGSYMSVVGWNSLLVGDWVVIALFVALDLAKIISVSFLYQTWAEIKKMWRAYMVFAVLFLMVLTSAGSFGYLTSAFQKASEPNNLVSMQLDQSSTERDQLLAEKKQLTDSKIKIYDQIAKLPSDSVAGRARLIANFREETRQINSRTNKINSRLDELNKTIITSSSTKLQKDSHIGPVVYISKTFNVPLEKVVTYAILSIIFVFDPLVISLIIAGNFLFDRRKKLKQSKVVEKTIEIKPKEYVDAEFTEHVEDEPVIQEEIIEPEIVVEPYVESPEITPGYPDGGDLQFGKDNVEKILENARAYDSTITNPHDGWKASEALHFYKDK